jgi:hypothetical protein
MSEDRRSLAETPADPRPRGARWLDVVSTALLVGAFAALALGAVPTVSHALGLIETRTAGSPVMYHPPGAGIGADLEEPSPTGLFEVPRLAEPDAKVRLGEARRRLPLFTEPRAGAEVERELSPGDVLIVLREIDGWLLVIHQQHSPDQAIGWVDARDVEIR